MLSTVNAQTNEPSWGSIISPPVVPRIFFFLFWTNGSPNTLYSCLKCILVRFSDWSKAASSSGLGGTPSLVALDLQAAWNVGYHLVASRLVQEVVVAEEEARWSATSYSCSWTSPRTPAPWAPGSGFEADVLNPFIKFLEHGNHNKVSRNLR